MKIERFEDIEAWKESRTIVNRVYRVCRVDGFRKDYGLADQIKRAKEAIANLKKGIIKRVTIKELYEDLVLD